MSWDTNKYSYWSSLCHGPTLTSTRFLFFFLYPITVSFRSETSTRFQVKVHWIIETKIANRSLFLIPDFSFLFSLLRVSLFTLELSSNGPTVRILYILCVCVVLQVTTLVPLLKLCLHQEDNCIVANLLWIVCVWSAIRKLTHKSNYFNST